MKTRGSSQASCTLMLAVAGIFAPFGATRSDQPFAPRIEGTVFLPCGRRAQNVAFEWYGTLKRSERGGPIEMSSGRLFTLRTDDQGRYHLPLVHAGKTLQSGISSLDLEFYLVSREGVGCAGPIKLRLTPAHQWARQNIGLRPGHKPSGKVLAFPGGEPHSGAKVYALLHQAVMRPFVIEEADVDLQGRFRMHKSLPPGAYYVGANAPGYALLEVAPSPSAMPRATEPLTISIIRHFTFRGSILGARGTPMRNHKITVCVMAKRDRSAAFGPLLRQDLTTDTYGGFTFRYEGRWDLGVPFTFGSPFLTICAEDRFRCSNQVTVDATKESQREVALRLSEWRKRSGEPCVGCNSVSAASEPVFSAGEYKQSPPLFLK